MHKIVIFSKEGCHLCERAIIKLQDFSETGMFDLEISDITKDSALFEKYFLSIPVVELDGRIVFRATDLRRPEDIEIKLDSIVSDL